MVLLPITPYEFSQLWHHVNRKMRELFRGTVEAFDLPRISYFLLRKIRREPGITLSVLARKVGAAKSQVSTLTEQLVKAGYVDRRSDPADQRVARLYTTEQAEHFLEKVDKRWQEVWEVVFEELPGNDFDEAARFLRSLEAALEQATVRLQSTDSTSPESAFEKGEVDR